MDERLPVPPVELRSRVGPIRAGVDSEKFYLEFGQDELEVIVGQLPAGWSWSGKSVLDFGCGSGRTLRQLHKEAHQAEIWGCDIDRPSIQWLRANFSPPFSFVLNHEVPPVELPSGKFDLIYTYSVFTHLSTHWAGWLLEMHRLLKVGGLLVATVMSEPLCMGISGEPWVEEHVGMNVYEEGQSWDLGGPMVLHSPWWIEAHWGRLFEIERFELVGSKKMSLRDANDRQSVLRARKTDRTASFDDLIRIDPSEPREATSLYHDVLHLRAEVAQLRAQISPSRPPRRETFSRSAPP
jgi:SAM-dependent methyltransferase